MLSPRKIAIALALLFALHIAVFARLSLVAERRTDSPDAVNYITVARNLSNGKGLTQSAPGFNQPGFWDEQFSPDFPPETRHSHSVAYPLAVFAFAEVFRLPHADAAFLLGVVGYFAAMILAFHIARRLWGIPAALLAAAIFPFELRDIFLRPWTEAIAIPMMLGALALLTSNLSAGKAAAAGLLSGFAVLTRTAMIPLAIVGAAICAVRREKMRLVLFAAVAALPLLGKFIGEGERYSTYTKLRLESPVDSFANFMQASAEEVAILAALSALALWRMRKNREAIFPLNLRGGETALWAWAAAYPAFLVSASGFYFFGSLGVSRYRDPMEAVMVILYAGLACRILAGWKKLPLVAAALFAVSMCVGMIKDARTISKGREVSESARIENSPRLSWARDNIRSDDFVLGADAMDLPYYFPETIASAASFSPHPFTIHISESQVDAIVRSRCGEFGRALLILRRGHWHPPERYGDFIGGLMRKEPTQNYSLLADLEDGTVYEMTHCAAPVGG